MSAIRLVAVAGAIAAAAGLPASGGGATGGTIAVTSIKFSGSWKESWLTAKVTYAGSVSDATDPVDLLAVLRPVGRAGVPAGSQKPRIGAAGSFSGSITLPPRLLPGTYRLTVTGRAGTTVLVPGTKDVTNPAPAEGIVDFAIASATKGGRKANTVSSPRKDLYARFHFLVRPKSSKVHIGWFSPNFRFLGEKDVPYKTTIFTHVGSDLPLARGVWFGFVGPKNHPAKRIRIRIR